MLGIHIRPYASGATEFALQECGGCFGYCKSCKRGMQFSEKRYVIEGFASVYIDEYTPGALTHTRTHTHTCPRSLAPSFVPSLPLLSLTHKIPLFPRGHVYDSLFASYSNMRRIEYEAACKKFSEEERVLPFTLVPLMPVSAQVSPLFSLVSSLSLYVFVRHRRV